jgi:uncharacterized membrane protein
MVLLFVFLAGLFTGLRSLTPTAATAWATHAGWLKPGHSLAWIGVVPAVAIFTLGAIAELVADKLPGTPSRTAPTGLIARILLGGFVGACVSTAGGQSAVVGALLGITGAVIGCFGGYQARKRLVRALGTPDFVVALMEHAVAICGSLWVVSRF